MWGFAKNKLVHRDSTGESSNLEGVGAELCITLLSRGLNFAGVKNRLRSADEAWIESFLEHGGLTAIFDALEVLGEKGFSSLADALKQLDCAACIKAVMNSQVGMDFIIQYPDKKYAHKLSEGTLQQWHDCP